MNIPWYVKAQARRKALGLTLAPLASALNIGESAMGHKLSGRRKASVEELRIIAKELKMTVQELVEDDADFEIARDEFEAEMIREVRAVGEQDRDTLLALIRAYVDARKSNSRTP